MHVFVVDLYPPEDRSRDLCKEILTDYFTKHNLTAFFLQENKYNVDPSWLKLKCFDYVMDEFILCWDMDLLPRKECPDITTVLNYDKINLVRDTFFNYHAPASFPHVPYFRYNCGLLGVPSKFQPLLDKAFNQYKPHQPAYEQFILNQELSNNNYKDVHELSAPWNVLLKYGGLKTLISPQANLVHFSDLRRTEWIALHHSCYFS